MRLHAENGCLTLDGGTMDYIRFGSGERILVILPGVGDGFRTVKGTALPFALGYRKLARDFTVYMFSRREPLPEHCSTREMAADLGRALDRLGLGQICLLGVSQGGMIAQWVAIDQPKRVDRLVLTVTAARPNETMREVLENWMALGQRGEYRAIMEDSALRSYSAKTAERQRRLAGLVSALTKPKDFSRFLIQAESCLGHDAWEELPRIFCPTLVIGGSEDGIVTAEGSRELARRIVGAELFLYEGLSHGLYEEAKDFLDRVRDFCLQGGEKGSTFQENLVY